MAVVKVAIKPLDDDLARKLCHNWPRRVALQAIFGSQQLIHSVLGLSFGQFLWVRGSNEAQFFLRAYPNSSIQDKECLFVHRDLMLAFSDEISLETVMCSGLAPNARFCSSVQFRIGSKVDEALLTAVKVGLKDYPVVGGAKYLVQHYGKPIVLTAELNDDISGAFSSLSLESDAKTSTPIRRSQAADQPCIISELTKVDILARDEETSDNDGRVITPTIGGVEEELSSVMSTIQLLSRPNSKRASVGILLYGPSGSGKTLMATVIASKLKAYEFTTINGSSLFSKYTGETEQKLRHLFEEGTKSSHSIIFIDEFDVLASQSGTSEQERRVSACLKGLMDELASNTNGRKVVLLAASSKPDAIESSFRRPGRLEIEIELPVPNFDQRVEIIKVILQKTNEILAEEDIVTFSRNAHGYVGADLEALIAQATLSSERLSLESCLMSLKVVKPSAMREVQINVPNVTWEDIGGLDELKLQLRQAVEWPIKNPEVFARMGVTPPKGVLMYGPPGCSKTMIAKALANESQLNFVAIKGPELFKKYVGESEQAVRQLFKKARRVAPCIVFFDEIDALGSERGSGSGKVGDRVLAQMLTEMDGIEQLKNVTVLAATNRPDMIDKALLRPGRLDRVVYVPLPDEKTRLKIFQIHTRNKPLDPSISLAELAQRTANYSGAEIAAICNEAALFVMEETLSEGSVKEADPKITNMHFEKAMNVVKPRINHSLLDIYDKFRA